MLVFVKQPMSEFNVADSLGSDVLTSTVGRSCCIVSKWLHTSSNYLIQPKQRYKITKDNTLHTINRGAKCRNFASIDQNRSLSWKQPCLAMRRGHSCCGTLIGRHHIVAQQCVYCCKGDAASQWERAILGVSELRNPWTDRLKIWHTWLRWWVDLICQIS